MEDDTLRKKLGELIDSGKLIEAGWSAFEEIFLTSPTITDQQRHDMMLSYMAGAQHIWGSMMALINEDEPNEEDFKRLQAISNEMVEFSQFLKVAITKRKGN